MTDLSHIAESTSASPPISPMMLSDQLLRIAKEADSAGLRRTAEYLLDLASEVLDEPAVFRLCTS